MLKNVLLHYSCMHEILVFSTESSYLFAGKYFLEYFLSHSYSSEFSRVSKRGFKRDI